MTKLLHIGLTKCGSTFLQKEIFPAVASKLKINYIDLYKIDFLKIKKKHIRFHALENVREIDKKFPKKFILSNESLFSRSSEFSNIFKSFEHIKKNFSENTTILIVIRNPYELLNSIYCQSIQSMNIVKPENYFYNLKKDNIHKSKHKFNLYSFDYDNLISLYKSYFKKVVVVKFEDLTNLNFLKEIFDLDEKFIATLKIKNKTYNQSISRYGINFILFVNNFINIEKNQKKLMNLIKPSDKIFNKIKNKILSQFLLRNFFQSKFDKIIPYKKYYIKKSHIPINIEKEILKYHNLKI